MSNLRLPWTLCFHSSCGWSGPLHWHRWQQTGGYLLTPAAQSSCSSVEADYMQTQQTHETLKSGVCWSHSSSAGTWTSTQITFSLWLLSTRRSSRLPRPCFTALLIPVFLLLQGGILAAVSGTSDGSSLTAVSYKLVLVTWEVWLAGTSEESWTLERSFPLVLMIWIDYE